MTDQRQSNNPRRGGVVSACLLVVSIVVFGGCSKSREDRVADAVRDGILSWSTGPEPADLDPQTVTGIPEHTVLKALTEGLVAENPRDLSPEPGVAERWDISEDGLVYTFHLRSDALWSNGEPVTAKDFELSARRILTQSIASEWAYLVYNYVENARKFYVGEIGFEEVGIKAIDDRTLVVRLKNPTPYFLNLLSHEAWLPVPIAVVDQFGGLTRRDTAWTRPENFVSNGAFRVKDWVRGQALIVEKSPTYWDRDRVRLNEIHFKVYEDPNTEERVFRAGQLLKTREIPWSKIDAYRRDDPESLKIEPFLGTYYYKFNTSRPPLDDVRVRRALALAIDRESIVKDVTRGDELPAYHFTPSGFPEYQPTANLSGDLDEARALLADAGFPNGEGFPILKLLYNTQDNHRVMAEAIQFMWREQLGIDVQLTNQEWGVYLDTLDKLDYDIARAGWIADYADPHTFVEILVTGGGNNDTGWGNEEFDALLKKSLAAKTNEERFGYYQRMDQIIVEELPVIPIYQYTSVYLMDPVVKGFYPTVLDNHPPKYIWLDE